MNDIILFLVYGLLGLIFYIPALCGFVELIRSVIAKLRSKKLPKIAHSNKSINVQMLTMLLVVLGTFVLPKQYLPFILLCGICLSIYILCAIICWKIWKNKPWKEIIGEGLGSFFTLIVKIREKLKRINGSKGWNIAGWAVFVVAIFALLSGILELSIPLFVFVFSCWFLDGLHSCRKLLKFWLILYMVLAVFWIFVIWVSIGTNSIAPNLSLVLYEVLLVVSLTAAWGFTIGVADHDVGKLAIQAINTITGIITVILTVIVACAGDAIHKPILVQLQTIILYILLPFVIAGSLASFLKASQIYWENKHLEAVMNEIREKRTYRCEKNLCMIKWRLEALTTHGELPKIEQYQRKIQRLERKQRGWEEELCKLKGIGRKESEKISS